MRQFSIGPPRVPDWGLCDFDMNGNLARHLGVGSTGSARKYGPTRQKGEAHKQPNPKFPRGEIPEIDQRRADQGREDAQGRQKQHGGRVESTRRLSFFYHPS